MEAIHSCEYGSVAEVILSWPLLVGLPKGGEVEGVAAIGHFLSHRVSALRAELVCDFENVSFSAGLGLPALSLPEKPSQPRRPSTRQCFQIQKTRGKEFFFPKVNGKSVTVMIIFPISHPPPCPLYLPTQSLAPKQT